MVTEVPREGVGPDIKFEQFPSAYKVMISPGSIEDTITSGVVEVPPGTAGAILKLVVTRV